MNLSAIPRHLNGVTILELRGRLTLGPEARFLRDSIQQLLAEDRTRIVLGFQHVRALDSNGVVTLLVCFARVQAAGGELKLAGLSPQLQKALETTRLLPLMEACASEEEALAGFHPPAADGMLGLSQPQSGEA